MFKRAITLALICLSVVPVNTHAASAADIDSLVAESQSEAQETVKQKIASNQQLIAEIIELEGQIQAIKSDVNLKRGEMNKELIIAAGTTIATTIAVIYLGRKGQSELGGEINAGIKAATFVLGSILTVKSLGSGGVQYLLLKVDEEKLPTLEAKLNELKIELQNQTAALLK